MNKFLEVGILSASFLSKNLYENCFSHSINMSNGGKSMRKRGIFTKLSKENKGSRKHATWARNHAEVWRKFKTRNRKLARYRLKEITKKEIAEDTVEITFPDIIAEA